MNHYFIISMQKYISKFEKHDWDHLHDVVLEATWNTTKLNLNQEQLEKLYLELPEDLKKDAEHWGLSDTVVRDNIYEWYQNK